MKPYKDRQLTETSKIRVFKSDVDSGELQWHRDREDRLVEVMEGNGWKFQLDNQLPINLTERQVLLIPQGTYHRIFKGKDDLKIKIDFI
jgi:quercetin dioxygenase-like cupin family protein